MQSVIARGGMGKVYKAEQAPLGRVCALKVLSPKYEGDQDPEFSRRFYLEAATASKLSHPNTVTIYDYGETDDGVFYIAMEFIEGKTLFRTLKEEGHVDESRTIHVASQVCRSLREAHRLDVVHRDLKPANILLSNRGDEHDFVKVLDFGLVKDVSGTNAEELTQAGLFMGSPKYMSPEQILGDDISPRSDIYSLGVIMFEMLSGKVPFDRGKSMATLMAHVKDPVPPLACATGLSPAMHDLVVRCLSKEPDERPASMDDVLKHLKAIAGGPGIKDTSESLPMHPMATSHPPTSGSIPAMPPLPGSPTDSATLRAVSPPDAMADPTLTSAAGAPRSNSGVIAIAAVGAALIGVAAAVLLAGATGDEESAEQNNASGDATAPAQPTTSPVDAETAATSTATKNVSITSAPEGAVVALDGQVLCDATPCELELKGAEAEGSLKLTFSKNGYADRTVTVGPSDASGHADLVRSPTSTAPTPPPATPPVTPPPPPPKAPPPPPPPPPASSDDYKPDPY